jgi:hypothetical protein
MKKVSSPQNFIVKHAKIHRYQIERDNTEVKALFSYLSRIYRAGCTVENVPDENNLPPDTDNVDRKQEVSSDPYQVEGADQSSDSSTAAKSSDRPKSFRGFEILRQTFFPSCSTSSTPSLSSSSYLESPANLVENLVNSSIDTHESVLCTMDNHERSSEKLMSDQFISSLCESGHLPLQFFLGSLPGVHIKYQELPHISPFTTAMLYLESSGMGFESIQFGFDTSDLGANDSIVSTDASSSGIRRQIGKEAKESRLMQVNGISTVEADHQYIYSDDLSVSVDHEANELEGKYSDCSPQKDSSDENRKPSLQSCAPDTAGRTRPHIPEVITGCDIFNGSIMSPQNQFDRGFTYCGLAMEAISAFLKVELPSTHAIDAAIDYLESQAIKLHAPSMCTPTMNIIAPKAQDPDLDTADALKNTVIGYNSYCSLEDGSSSPSQWMPTSHTEQPSVSPSSALSPISSSLVSTGGAEGGLPECFLELTTPHTTLTSPTKPASDPERSESIMDVITNDVEVLEEVHSAPYIEMDLSSRVPSFPIRSLNLSPCESTDLEEEVTVPSGRDAVPLDLLGSVENAVKYLEKVALSAEDKEAFLAISALKSFSNTLLLSSRVLDLKNYPLWGPNSAPMDPSHSLTTVSASPLEQHMRSFAKDLARKLSGNGCMGDISVPTVSDWMSAYPMNVVADDRIAPPVHEFLSTSDFKNMTDTSGAVALLALMADCVCSSEFDSYFEEKSTSILRRRDRESTPIENKRRKIVAEDHSSEQCTSKRQQRCPRCGEFKKGHTCRFPGYTEPPSPRMGL